MAVFREKNPPFIFAVLLLAAAFFFIYPLTEIGKMELFQQEGFYAALALETGSFPVVSKAHGEVVAYTYPLYPFLVKLLHSTGLSMEYSLRILSLFFLFVLSVTVGCTCYFAAYLMRFPRAVSPSVWSPPACIPAPTVWRSRPTPPRLLLRAK